VTHDAALEPRRAKVRQRQADNETAILRALFAKARHPKLPDWANADDITYHHKTGGAGWPFPTVFKPDHPISRGELSQAALRLARAGLIVRSDHSDAMRYRLTETGEAAATALVVAQVHGRTSP
jgi:hypothetical protein